MAEELKIGTSFSYLKDGMSLSLALSALAVDVAGDGAIHTRQNIGFAAEEALLVPADIATLGYCIVVNRDSTNFVEIRPGTGVQDMIVVRPGKFAVFEFAPGVTAPYAIADTAAVEIEFILLEL
jgi:hypothetical protein